MHSLRSFAAVYANLLAGLATILLASCGGGGGGASAPPPVVNQSVAGIWKGQFTTTAGVSVAGTLLVAPDGTFYSEAKNLTNNCADVGKGSLTTSGSTVTGSEALGLVSFAAPSAVVQVNCTFPDGSTSGTGTLTGTVVQGSTLTLTPSGKTASGTTLPSNTVALTFDTLYNESSSLGKIAGYWNGPTGNVLNISSSGALSSTDPASGCAVSGQASIINSSYNLYTVSAKYSGCQGNAAVLNGLTATGLLTLNDTVSPNLLIAGYSVTLASGAVVAVAADATRAISQDAADAQAAALSARLAVPTNAATLTWIDSFPTATAYLIQQQSPGGSWTTIDSVPGQNGSGRSLTWSTTVNVTTTLRVEAQLTGYAVPLGTPSGNTSVAVTVPATTPTIQLDQPQPVSGTVNASIAGGVTYSSVSYYLDLNLIGSSSTGPGYAVAFDTKGLTSGPHLVLARLATGADSYLELRLTVQVANPSVAIQLSVDGTSGTAHVNVVATSSYGVASVTATLDGTSLGTLTATNACLDGPCLTPIYQFAVNATAAGSGVHTISAQATDRNGSTASQTTTVTFNNPPVLTLTSPFDGVLVNGTLQVSGSFRSDKPSATISLAVTLGSLPILNTTSSPFSTSFSLAGVVPGTYTLTAIATDNSGASTVLYDQVTVTSSPALVYTPVFTLGGGAWFQAVSSAYVLYSASDGSIHLYSMSKGDSVLPLGSIRNISNWAVTDGGYVIAQGWGGDRVNAEVSIYMWSPGSAAATNLSSQANSMGIDDELLSVHYPWVFWSSSPTNQDVLYNAVTRQQFDIAAPVGTTIGNYLSDFAVVNGQLTAFYYASSVGTTGSSVVNVFRWDQSTGASMALTSDGVSRYPQTDGVRVAWQTNQSHPAPFQPYTLSVRDLASNSTTVLSMNMDMFQLDSGLLGWVDQTYTAPVYGTVASQTISASDGNTIATISTVLTSKFYGSSGGYVVFEENSKLYAWSTAGGRQILFDAVPGQVHLSGKTVYFTDGAQQVLYVVTLN